MKGKKRVSPPAGAEGGERGRDAGRTWGMWVGHGTPSPTASALWEPSAAGADSCSPVTATVPASDQAPPACQGSVPRTAAAAGMQHYPQSMDHYVINKRKVVLQMRLSYHFTTRWQSISPPSLTRMDRCWGQMGADSKPLCSPPGSRQRAHCTRWARSPPPCIGGSRGEFHNIEQTESGEGSRAGDV